MNARQILSTILVPAVLGIMTLGLPACAAEDSNARPARRRIATLRQRPAMKRFKNSSARFARCRNNWTHLAKTRAHSLSRD
jgi:hypothetical protein